MEKNKTHYASIAKLSVKYRCSPSQLALAWLLHQGDDILPIPGKSYNICVIFFGSKLLDYVLFCIIISSSFKASTCVLYHIFILMPNAYGHS